MEKLQLDIPINADQRLLHGINVRLDELNKNISELVKSLSGKATEKQVAQSIQEKAHEILVKETEEYNARKRKK